MVYRLATIGIAVFWLVMMGLLVRLETNPEGTDILDVPVSYVTRIMFKHGQQSILTVREEEKPAGTFSVRPMITGSDGRSIDFSGTLTLQLPLGAQDRLNFNGALDMDKTLRLAGFHVQVSTMRSHYHLSASGDTSRNSLSYEVRQETRPIAAQTLPMDSAALAPALLQSMGLSGAALPISTGNIPSPTVTARETQITLPGGQLEVYQLTVHQGSGSLADIYVTQLGQIVRATTSFGYTFAAEEYQ